MILGALPGDPKTVALGLGLLALGPLIYVGWRRPVVLVVLVLLAVAIPYEVRITAPFEASFALADLGSIFALVVIGIRALLRTERSLPPVFAGILCACLIASALATFFATDGTGSLAGFGRFTQMLIFVPLVAYLAIEGREDQRVFVGALILLGLVESAFAIQQYVTGTGANFATPGAEETADVRGFGTFGAENIMALPIIVSAALLAAFAVAIWTTGRPRVLALVALIPLMAGLLVSLSRGAWVASLVGVVVIGLYRNHRATLAAAAAGTALVLAVGQLSGGDSESDLLASRATSLAETPSNPDQSVTTRYGLWDAAVGMWRDDPVTGVGIQGFVRYRDNYLALDSSARADVSDPASGFRRVELASPHNLALLVLSEQGILGLSAYGLLFALTLVMAFQACMGLNRVEVRDSYKPFQIALLAWFASFLVRSLYGDIGGPTVVLEGILIGAVFRVAFEQRDHGIERAGSAGRRTAASRPSMAG
jgi:O-antigen ligase